MLDVSVIVPVYNMEKYIRPSLDSIVAQDYENMEIILVDDGSTDASGAICDTYAKKDSRVRVIHKKNEGTGFARNTGMDVATGEYLYFCDPDDVLEPGLIADNIALAHTHHADIVVFGYRKIYIDEHRHPISREPDALPAVSGLYTRQAFAENFRETFGGQYTLWTKLFRRRLLEEHHIRSTSQRLAQDVLLLLDIFRAPFQTVYFHQKAYYNYYVHPRSATTFYNLIRFDCEFNTAKKKEQLIESFRPYHCSYEDIICRSYLESVNMAFGAFSIWDAAPELTWKQQLAILKDVFSRPQMQQAVRRTTFSMYPTKLGKVKLLLFKCKCYRTLILIGRLIGRKYRKFS